MPAIDLYCGAYFIAMKRWSLSITPPRCIYILSAKHGLIKSNTRIAPYDLKINLLSPKVFASKVAHQAALLDLKNASCIFVGGKFYYNVLKECIDDSWSLFDIIQPNNFTIDKQVKWLYSNSNRMPSVIYENFTAN